MSEETEKDLVSMLPTDLTDKDCEQDTVAEDPAEFVDENVLKSTDSDQEDGGESPSDEEEITGAELIALLEEEGDIAADYLEELLDIVDLGGEFEIDIENDRATVEIVAEGGDERRLQRLVGEDGNILGALQELTRLAVQTKTGERSRLMLDIAGYRKARRKDLSNIAQEAVNQVLISGEAVKLSAMNPFERKICHDVIAANGLTSDSEGIEPNRRVVVRPRA